MPCNCNLLLSKLVIPPLPHQVVQDPEGVFGGIIKLSIRAKSCPSNLTLVPGAILITLLTHRVQTNVGWKKLCSTLERSITIAIYASPQPVYHSQFLEDNIVLEPMDFSFLEDISFND